MFCEGPVVEKPIEGEMIKCFELALNQSCKSRTKKKQFIEDCIYLSQHIS